MQSPAADLPGTEVAWKHNALPLAFCFKRLTGLTCQAAATPAYHTCLMGSIELGKGGQTNANHTRSNFFHHSLHDLKAEAAPVLDGPSVLICKAAPTMVCCTLST